MELTPKFLERIHRVLVPFSPLRDTQMAFSHRTLYTQSAYDPKKR